MIGMIAYIIAFLIIVGTVISLALDLIEVILAYIVSKFSQFLIDLAYVPIDSEES